MKKQFNIGLLIAALFLVASCSSEPKQTQPVTSKTDAGTSTAPPAKEVDRRNNALVRVINTVPAASSFDVFVDDQKVFDRVAFKSVTPYKELPGTRHTFRIRQAGQDNAQPVTENSEGLAGGKHYTILVMPGTNDKVTVSIINDNLAPPPADKAQVRVINASPDVGEVDVVDKQGDKKLFSGINFEKGSGYKDMNPARTTLEVRSEGQDKPILTLPNANFEKGKFYTIVVAGHAAGNQKLQAVMVEDKFGADATAATTQNPSMSDNGKTLKTKSTY
jgi:Domain of unknown function (DUF4397)